MKQFVRANGNLLALVFLLVLIVISEFAVHGESFVLTPENLSNLTLQVTITSVLAVGMTYVILIGGIDLGVGSLMALFGVLYLQIQNPLFESIGSPALAIIIGIVATLAAALLIGLFDGFMIGRFLIPPFVITLGVLSAARGGALLLSGATGLSDKTNIFKSFASWYLPKWISGLLLVAALVVLVLTVLQGVKRKKRYGLAVSSKETAGQITMGALAIGVASYVFLGHNGIPMFVAVLIAIVLIASFVLRFTPFGRRVYAIGGNEQAARLSGINVFRVRLTVFTVMTLLACVAGLLNAARSGGVSPGVTGLMAELDAVAAVVIGGTSLMGGVGTVEGSIIGALIIGVLRNGMTLLGIDANWEYVVRGFVVILAVWFDVSSKNR